MWDSGDASWDVGYEGSGPALILCVYVVWACVWGNVCVCVVCCEWGGGVM